MSQLETYEEFMKRTASPAQQNTEEEETYEEFMQRTSTAQDVKGPTYGNSEVFESDMPEDQRLKKKDLYQYENINKIRNYMTRNKGVDYKTAKPEDVVEDFVDHMRKFNTNTISTAGEVMFVSRGSAEDKAAAGEAYQLYDQLGNVFVNDGFFGAVDGVKDYVFAAVKDPTNYLGVLTGGVGKASALGVTQASKKAIKKAASNAAMKSARSGATKEAAKKAAEEASDAMAKKMIANSVKGSAVAKASQAAAQQAYREAIIKGSSEGIEAFTKDRMKAAGKKAVAYTTAFDAFAAAIQTDAIQDIYLDVGAQDEYSKTQTLFSTLLGGVGGGLHYTFGKFEGASGLGSSMADLNARSRAKELPTKAISNLEEKLKKLKASNADAKQIEAIENRIKELKKNNIGSPLLSATAQKSAEKAIKDNLDSWAAKVERGTSKLGNDAMPEAMLESIMFGSDGKSGLTQIFKDNGIKLKRSATVSDVMTNIVRYMDEADLQKYSAQMYVKSGIHLGDLDGLAVDIGDVMAREISRAGKTLSVMSRVRRVVDGGVVAGNETLTNALNNKEIRDALENENALARRAKPFVYGQNVWKRLLVSSPATTSANVMGFGQYYAGQTVSDLLTSGALGIASLGSGGNRTKIGRELGRQSDIYKQIQMQKMRNLLDPFTTHDVYMDFLNKHKDVKGLLFETVGAAVERSSKRYGIDESNKIVYGKFGIENFTDAAMNITGVRIQDSFTKSQMFMTDLDKYLRLKSDRTLADVLQKGDLEVLDDDVIGAALDTTMRSVFSKDYTTDDQMLGGVAKLVEQASNTPGLGTILPFGRFMNNVVATAYQWSPLSFLPAASRIMRKSKRDITSMEAVSRSVVGSASLGLAMHYSEKQEEKGLAYNEIDAGGGTIVDVRNVFPFSFFLAAGRAANLNRKGEPITKEVREDLLNQLAIGQVARDTQFANDLYNVFDFITGEEGSREAGLDSLYKSAGNIGAGFFRPLDAVNRAVGFMTETDIAKDPRQARGGAVFTQQATKYFDNIIEAFIGETDTLTGEQLRVATREGEIYDPNPLSRIFGLTVKRGRTAAEKAYSMAEMKTWTADSRSKMTQYDRVFNSSIAPLLETKLSKLIQDKRFIEGDLSYRRDRLKAALNEARGTIRDHLDSTSGTNFIERMRYKASTKGNKEQRAKAMKFMQSKGVEARLEDFNFRELQMYNSYIEHLNYIAKGN